jgi:photosystem II stability/assembly factor-like uncharacterized protein
MATKTNILMALAVASAGVVAALGGLLGEAPAAVAGGPKVTLGWDLRPTGTDSRLRGVSAVNANVAWVSGSGGTVLRTLDGGSTWEDVSPPDGGEQQFRDVEAFGGNRAVVLAIGPGEASRLYLTDDGGETWTLAYQNTDPAAFYDCMAFWDRRHGLVLGDPVNGKFQILATEDGGRSWALLPSDEMPDALAGEFAFAASGTCIEVAGGQDAWFGTGGGAVARVFHSGDRGESWDVVDTPVRSGPTAGIYSLAFDNRRRGIAVGGDFTTPTEAPAGAAYTSDGGEEWRLASGPEEYRSGSAWVPRLSHTAVAVGPTGSDVSTDDGTTWVNFDTGSFDAVDCRRNACWAAGEAGRAAILRVDR